MTRRHIKIQADALIVFWVNPTIRNRVVSIAGTRVILVACSPLDLERHTENVHNYKVVFSEDEDEAMKLADEFAQKKHRREVMKSPTVYMQVNPAAA